MLFVNEMESDAELAREFISSTSPQTTPTFFYATWSVRRGVEALQEKLQKVLQHKRKSTPDSDVPSSSSSSSSTCSSKSRSLLSIEVLLSDTQWETNGDKDKIQDLYQWIKDHFDVGYIVFGLTDHTSGTLALDVLYECVMALSHVNEKEDIAVVALNNEEFLGHDATRDPDAQSGVLQVICSSSNEKHVAWCVPGYDRKTQSEANARMSKSSTSSSGFQTSASTLLLLFLAAFFSYVFAQQWIIKG